MAARRPAYTAGQYYHFYNRGAHRAPIFRDDANYSYLLRLVKKYCQNFHLVPIAYCLMPNHYHFLIRQEGEKPAGLLPQSVFNSYSKAYNKRYQHHGTLFEGPYNVRLVANDPYLLHLCRYIHANPVRAGLVARPEEWEFSNYQEWIGARQGKLVDKPFIDDLFPAGSSSYEAFVWDYLELRQLPEALDYLDRCG